MKINASRQLSFEFGRPAMVVPATPAAERITIAECRRILHAAQVMQLDTARPAHELDALGRVEAWMRRMIRERV
jgi:hypothetical protein